MTTSDVFSSDKDYDEEATVIYQKLPFIDTEEIISLKDFIAQISILKFEFCNLTADQIEILADLLTNNQSIIEVSVNGNPNDVQNFYLLLHKTKITMLSLKFCSIDNKGTEKISNELYAPYETHLLHLNLSSNLIGNNGIKHIAHFLRINRTLISLNLADNNISNKGCTELTDLLQMFPLNSEEIVTRRKIKFAIERSIMENSLAKESTQSRLSVTDAVNHPFMKNIFDENQHLQCQGNDVLFNLNLCYNRISYPGLNEIIQMVQYQTKNYPQDKGISRISIEGNDFKHCEELLSKLTELLELKMKKRVSDNKKRSYMILRKKS